MYLGDLIKRQPSEQHIGCMLKVTSRELAGIWLAVSPQTLLVSNQQCGQSHAVDGKTPDAYAASSNSFINLPLYAIHFSVVRSVSMEVLRKSQGRGKS